MKEVFSIYLKIIFSNLIILLFETTREKFLNIYDNCYNFQYFIFKFVNLFLHFIIIMS